MSKDELLVKMERDGVKTKHYICPNDDSIDISCPACGVKFDQTENMKLALLKCGHFFCTDCEVDAFPIQCGIKGCRAVKRIKTSPYNTLMEYIKVIQKSSFNIREVTHFRVNFTNMSTYKQKGGDLYPSDTTFQALLNQHVSMYQTSSLTRQNYNIMINRQSSRFSEIKELTIKQFFVLHQKKLPIKSNPPQCSIMIHTKVNGGFLDC